MWLVECRYSKKGDVIVKSGVVEFLAAVVKDESGVDCWVKNWDWLVFGGCGLRVCEGCSGPGKSTRFEVIIIIGRPLNF